MENETILKEVKAGKFSLFGLICAQFFGAFNDNAWKLIVFTIATRFLLFSDPQEFEAVSQVKATEALLVFLIPMLLASFPAAIFSDKFSKRTIIWQTKALECLLMALATVSVYLYPTYVAFPYFLLALMGLQSALFSPAKYGIIPELYPYEYLSRVNGTLEMWSMLAIIAGTGLGPILLFADKGGARPSLSYIAPLILFFFSLIGLVSSFLLPYVLPSQEKKESIKKTLLEGASVLSSDRILLLAVLGTAFYWGMTSLLGQNVLVYAKTLVVHLEKGELFQGIPPASYGIGIAFGAYFSGKFSKSHIEYGLIPLGAVGFALAAFILGIAQPKMGGTVATLIFAGFSAGMLIIPLQAIIQWRSPGERIGSVISLTNAINIVAMIFGSLFAYASAKLGMTLKATLLFSAFIVLSGTIWALRLLPEALARLVLIILTNSFYKIKIRGEEHIPKSGACLLISNHLSAIDAFFIMAAVDRPVHFLISRKHFSKWWFKPFALAAGAIPLDFEGKEEEKQKSLLKAFALLKRGRIVCMFPEGSVSRTGSLQPFKEELSTLLDKSKWPIIPIFLDGVTDTLFSPTGGKYLPKHSQKFPHPVTVMIGEPFKAAVIGEAVRDSLNALAEEAKWAQLQDDVPCHVHFIRFVWRAPWKLACQGRKSNRVSRGRLLSYAVFFARRLKEKWGDSDNVFILLPPSVDGAAVNIAASLAGKIASNGNYSSYGKHLSKQMEECGTSLIITSKAFAEQLGIAFPQESEVVDVDEMLAEAKKRKLIFYLLLGMILPPDFLGKYVGFKGKTMSSSDPLSTHISESGRVCTLTHQNVLAAADSASQVLPSTRYTDKLLHLVPFFDQVGYTALWTALLHPMPIVFYDDLFDTQGLMKVLKKRKPNLLFASPRVLEFLIKTLPPGALGSVQAAISYSSSYDEELLKNFSSKFGIQPLCAFSLAECAGLISTNTLDVRRPGVFQQGRKEKSTGRPLPGVLVKVVDLETKETLTRGNLGTFFVKGPQVVTSYFSGNKPEIDQEGWLNTEISGFQDEHDFLHFAEPLPASL